MQLDKKKQREVTKRQKEVEKRSRQTMMLKLRDVGPPDDLDIEMADLRSRQSAPDGQDGSQQPASESQQMEDVIERPPFPPPDVADQLLPAFAGAALQYTWSTA
jgi:hypothetical protein